MGCGKLQPDWESSGKERRLQKEGAGQGRGCFADGGRAAFWKLPPRMRALLGQGEERLPTCAQVRTLESRQCPQDFRDASLVQKVLPFHPLEDRPAKVS